MKKAILLLSLAAAACATPAERREKPARLTAQTEKSVQAFSGCFIDYFDKAAIRPDFRPRANGASIELNISSWAVTNTIALVDIDDLGTKRNVKLFSVRPEKHLVEWINACL